MSVTACKSYSQEIFSGQPDCKSIENLKRSVSSYYSCIVLEINLDEGKTPSDVALGYEDESLVTAVGEWF